MNGKTKKAVKWSAVTIIPLIISVLVLWEKGGAFLEPAVTQKVTAKVEVVARKHDADQKEIMSKLDSVKSDLMNKMDENNREQIRLIVQALRTERGIP